MKIYLARHAQTNYNELGLCNSDPSVDVHLSEVGIKQAKLLGIRLKDVTFEHVFVSELKRTQQTAEFINEYHSQPVTIDARLNDNNSGYEGMPVSEYYAAREASSDKWSVRLNDGESMLDVRIRVQSYVAFLKKQPYRSVLIVTSMAIVKAISGVCKDLTDDEIWTMKVPEASFLELNL